MNDERRIELEVEVPVGPEEAWEAIATGPGITAWFMPAEVEGRVGGAVIHHHDADLSSEGRVIAYDPPRRFAYEEDGETFAPPGGPPVMATEFLVESRRGGTCVVRVVMSGFGEGDAWNAAIESYTGGWRRVLASLELYLTHFRGEPVASINAARMMKPDPGLWPRLASSLGIPAELKVGDHIATDGEAPPLAGRIEGVGDGMATLLLDRPSPGIGFVGIGEPADQAVVVVRCQLFGAQAAAIAAREQGAWRRWLADRLG